MIHPFNPRAISKEKRRGRRLALGGCLVDFQSLSPKKVGGLAVISAASRVARQCLAKQTPGALGCSRIADEMIGQGANCARVCVRCEACGCGLG
jgi:hypothetical protein